jgi:hypothetical protein
MEGFGLRKPDKPNVKSDCKKDSNSLINHRKYKAKLAAWAGLGRGTQTGREAGKSEK